ncbi:MAG: F0F1 ATP synthase subunit B [Solirubrobacterales bacterium]
MERRLHSAAVAAIALPIAQGEDSTFIVLPKPGLMIWTLIVFFGTLLVLAKFALPRIQTFLEDRAQEIRTRVETAERVRTEADELLREYRKRLTAARKQADEIIGRAQRAAEDIKERAKEEGKAERERQVNAAKQDIEEETRRSIQRIRAEVLELTILATEKVTRKTLDSSDHEHLIEEALQEADFSVLTASDDPRSGNGS